MRVSAFASTEPACTSNDPRAMSRDISPAGHIDFLRKCQHVRRLLVAHGIIDDGCETAYAWTLAFADEADPTFCVSDWVEAGWRDPLVVDATLRVCSTREKAETCMAWLGKSVSAEYSHTIIAELSYAMIALGQTREPENDP